LPLAIELAAARLKLLSLSTLSERLKYRFTILTGGPWMGWLAMQRNNEGTVRFLLEESRALARDRGDKRPLGYILYFLAEADIEQGKYTEARSLLEEGLALFRGQYNKEDIAWGFFNLGYVLFAQGDEAYASVLVENSLHLFREIQNKVGAVSALYLLSRLDLAQDEVTKALARLEEGLMFSQALRLPEFTAHVLSQLAGIVFLQGNHATEALNVTSGRRTPFLLTIRARGTWAYLLAATVKERARWIAGRLQVDFIREGSNWKQRSRSDWRSQRESSPRLDFPVSHLVAGWAGFQGAHPGQLRPQLRAAGADQEQI
jgi:tetratricopeptide (TPR) repeat protein